MALIRWEPTREISSLQGEVNRLFSSFFDSPTDGVNGARRSWIPAMDLHEDGDVYVLRADLPGLDEAEVNIEVEDRVLTISGERRSTHEDRRDGYVRVERAYGSFGRSLTLPEGVDPEAIEAAFDKGVLELRIPKPEERKPRKVAIGAKAKTIDAP